MLAFKAGESQHLGYDLFHTSTIGMAFLEA